MFGPQGVNVESGGEYIRGNVAMDILKNVLVVLGAPKVVICSTYIVRE